MKCIIAGSRTATCENVSRALEVCAWTPEITLVVSGTARGADKVGEWWAEKNSIEVKRFPADWDRFGKRAGYLRNEQMAKFADALIAVWDGQSKGTKYMIDIAREQGLEVFIYIFK